MDMYTVDQKMIERKRAFLSVSSYYMMLLI